MDEQRRRFGLGNNLGRPPSKPLLLMTLVICARSALARPQQREWGEQHGRLSPGMRPDHAGERTPERIAAAEAGILQAVCQRLGI